MVLDTLRDYECRFAIAEDLDAVYKLLEPLVCDENEHKSLYEMNQRKLQKYLKYAVKTNQCIIVTKDNEVTSAYAGDRDTIIYLGTKGTDVVSTTLIMHTVLNKIHNRFAESRFTTTNNKQRKAWNVTALGEDAVEIDPTGMGAVKITAKDKIERLYNSLKG